MIWQDGAARGFGMIARAAFAEAPYYELALPASIRFLLLRFPIIRKVSDYPEVYNFWSAICHMSFTLSCFVAALVRGSGLSRAKATPSNSSRLRAGKACFRPQRGGLPAKALRHQ